MVVGLRSVDMLLLRAMWVGRAVLRLGTKFVRCDLGNLIHASSETVHQPSKFITLKSQRVKFLVWF